MRHLLIALVAIGLLAACASDEAAYQELSSLAKDISEFQNSYLGQLAALADAKAFDEAYAAVRLQATDFTDRYQAILAKYPTIAETRFKPDALPASLAANYGAVESQQARIDALEAELEAKFNSPKGAEAQVLGSILRGALAIKR